MIHEASHWVEKDGISPASTLYLGGGTPSMLSPKHLDYLLSGLRRIQYLTDTSDICMEANPATFTLKKAQLFRELGVTRVSLGIQSFTASTLKTLGREHSPEQAAEAVHLLREAGIPEISIDLMFSIPGQSRADWQHDLDTAVSLQPEHISAYNLTYEEDTAYFDKLTAGEYADDPDLNADLFHAAHETLTRAGFHHYETSNYARKGHESTHNKGYWQGHDYLGLGPSAVSTINARRWKNIPDTARYISQIQAVGHAMSEIEELSEEDLRIERIAMSLRTARGLPLALVKGADIDAILDAGYATLQGDSLVLTESGQPLVDEIAGHLL